MSTFFTGPFALTATAAAATFLTGLAGSPHCALMCGPLACAGTSADARERRHAAVGWQAGRVVAYAILGAVLGALGRGTLALFAAPASRALPWLMAAGLVLSALEVGRRLPRLPGTARVALALARAGSRLPTTSRAAVRGAATPFLPCGLLYGAFVVAIGTGAWSSGLLVMVAFAAGAIPALAFVQANARWMAGRPRMGRVVRRLLPLLAAGVVVWRTLAAPPPGQVPACHHAGLPVPGAALSQTLDENRPGVAARGWLR